MGTKYPLGRSPLALNPTGSFPQRRERRLVPVVHRLVRLDDMPWSSPGLVDGWTLGNISRASPPSRVTPRGCEQGRDFVRVGRTRGPAAPQTLRRAQAISSLLTGPRTVGAMSPWPTSGEGLAAECADPIRVTNRVHFVTQSRRPRLATGVRIQPAIAAPGRSGVGARCTSPRGSRRSPSAPRSGW